MAFDRFLIAPIKSGLMTNTKSWQIMDDAFEYLQNVYAFRGRLRKRFGSQLLGTSPLTSRLRIQIGTTDASGNLAFTTIPSAILNPGSLFSAGMIQFSVTTVPIVVGNAATLSTDQGPGGPAVGTVRLDSTGPNVYQFRITGGQTSIALSSVYWYPGLPVMGIDQYEIGSINNHPTYAFDQQFAYLYTSSGFIRSGLAVFNGTNLNFFWACNWQGLAGDIVMFVTNFNATVGAGKPAVTDDPMWWLDGSTWTAISGSTANGFFFLPAGGAVYTGPFVQTARIIVAFKNRLLLLNTIENDNSATGGVGTATQYKNRCRFSFFGSPFAVNAWYEQNQVDGSGNVAAGGGFVDATTEEAIISAEFIKDRLIVYFERSTWELVYTQNEVLPFVFQKINTELGSQSTFSTVPFDRNVLTIGNTGVHACSGSNVARIDEKIPDEIFEFKTKNDAPQRICGIRDYFAELVYWSFVADWAQPTQIFPTSILVYNYQNDTWALNDDCFTAFGYLEQQADITWESSAPQTWESFDGTWISGVIQAQQRQILAGTPEGFVLKLDVDEARNAPSMYITDIDYSLASIGFLTLTIYNSNLSPIQTELPNDEDYIWIENIVADTQTVAALNGKIFKILQISSDGNSVDIVTVPITMGAYLGGGTAARVSNVQLESKAFNPYADKNMNVYISKIDFAVQKTVAGAIVVDYKTSYANNLMLTDAKATGTIMGTGILETFPYSPVLYPLETFQSLLWHPIYLQSSGEFIQLAMYFNDDQMTNVAIAGSDFEIQAFCLYTLPVGRMQ